MKLEIKLRHIDTYSHWLRALQRKSKDCLASVKEEDLRNDLRLESMRPETYRGGQSESRWAKAWPPWFGVTCSDH